MWDEDGRGVPRVRERRDFRNVMCSWGSPEPLQWMNTKKRNKGCRETMLDAGVLSKCSLVGGASYSGVGGFI